MVMIDKRIFTFNKLLRRSVLGNQIMEQGYRSKMKEIYRYPGV